MRAALQEATGLAARTLEVDRVGIWLFVDERSAIRCFDVYERAKDQHSEGALLRAADFPGYFRALEERREVAAESARDDPMTHELRAAYLEPLGIVSMLDAPSLSNYDLRRYNVLILPPSGDGLDSLLKLHAAALREWVRAGGTLIACGNAAGRVANRSLELSAVVRRQDALKELDLYADAVKRERSARKIELDYGALWGEGQSSRSDETPEEPEADSPSEKEEGARLEARDSWQRRFSPPTEPWPE